MATFTGPLFDGVAQHEAHAACEDIRDSVAGEAERLLHARLHEVIRHPTGHYESHIGIEPEGLTAVVNDGGVVYGPWLNGTSSRNRTTRFKGYGTFRVVAQDIQRTAKELAEEAARPHIRRMG